MDFKRVKKVRIHIGGEDRDDGDLYVDETFDGKDPLGEALEFLEAAAAELEERISKAS